MAVFLVAVGGGLGATLRYGCIRYVEMRQKPFYLATFLVNILGSFVMGILLQYVNGNPQLWLFLATGVLGGFTTFSSFAYDVLRLYEQQEKMRVIMYTVCTLVIGMLAVVTGYYIAT